MAFAETLAPFLLDFGVVATLASGASVTGIFDAAGVDILTAASVGPQFMAKTSDIGSLAYGATLTISSVSYTVRQNDPDGTGMSRLILERT